jgi:hypothetical protein
MGMIIARFYRVIFSFQDFGLLLNKRRWPATAMADGCSYNFSARFKKAKKVDA